MSPEHWPHFVKSLSDLFNRSPCPASMSAFTWWEHLTWNQLLCRRMGQDKGKWVNVFIQLWDCCWSRLEILFCSILSYCLLGGRLPAVLREVQLDLVDPAKCKYVLQTVKKATLNQGPVRPQAALTVLCAGPERGGRDACQVAATSVCLSIRLHFVQEPNSTWANEEREMLQQWYLGAINNQTIVQLYYVALNSFCWVFIHQLPISLYSTLYPLSRGTPGVLWYVRQGQAVVNGRHWA